MKKNVLKDLEKIINLDEFTNEWESDNPIDLDKLCIKYNCTPNAIEEYTHNHHLRRSQAYINKRRKEACLRKYGVENQFQRKEVKEKIKQTNLEKYGVEYSAQSLSVKEKSKQTSMEKYGTVHPSQNNNVKNKRKQTCLERYGVENPLQNEEIQKKTKQTCLDKYGTICPLQNEDIKEKIKQTNIVRYGVENPLVNAEIKEKIKETNLKKYGVEWTTQSEDVKNKIKQTCLERYGVENPLQNKEVKAKMKQTIQEKYGVDYACQADFCKNASNGMHSKPNEEFAKLLNENKIIFDREFPLENMSYDFKIGNTLVEIDPTATHNSTFGTHGTTGLDKDYHRNKSLLAMNHDYNCIHVFDWDNEEKIIRMLQPKTTIYARKCEIRELVDGQEYRDFINANHLQGYCKGNKIIIGLYYNNILVEVLSFGKPRYNKNYEYELLRLCSEASYSVMGGTKKIFDYFINKYNPKSVISYCDNAKFSGKIYNTLGFKLKRGTRPSKHWYNLKTKKHITDNLLRQRGFDQLFDANYGKGTSNEELMKGIGFVEIYDCGQSTFTWEREE